MKYLIILLFIVILKYIFNREGLYDKKNVEVYGGVPDVSKLTDNNPTTSNLLEKANKVDENIFKKQISAINTNNIPLLSLFK